MFHDVVDLGVTIAAPGAAKVVGKVVGKAGMNATVKQFAKPNFLKKVGRALTGRGTL